MQVRTLNGLGATGINHHGTFMGVMIEMPVQFDAMEYFNRGNILGKIHYLTDAHDVLYQKITYMPGQMHTIFAAHCTRDVSDAEARSIITAHRYMSKEFAAEFLVGALGQEYEGRGLIRQHRNMLFIDDGTVLYLEWSRQRNCWLIGQILGKDGACAKNDVLYGRQPIVDSQELAA